MTKILRLLFLLIGVFSTNLNAQSALNVYVGISYATCQSGYTDGHLSASAYGGILPYQYLWNNGATTVNISSLTLGTYSVTVTDAVGTKVSSQAQVSEDSGITFDSSYINNAYCDGSKKGSIIIRKPGYFPPFTYQWSNNIQFQADSAYNLNPGTYNVTITDAKGCSSINFFDINSKIDVKSSQTLATCKEAGEIRIDKVIGAALPITYSWSNGANTPQVVGLQLGNYFLTITDKNGCSTTEYFYITSNIPYTQLRRLEHGLCGQNNGYIEVSAFGGKAPYTYKWNTGVTIPVLNNLSSGQYTCTITDSEGCSSFQTYEIKNNINLAIEPDINCGANNGQLGVQILKGGNPPFSFNWNNGSKNKITSINAEGYYSITVIDAKGCSGNANFYADFFQSLIFNIVNSYEPYDCPTLNPVLNNGLAPFKYLWSTGTTDKHLESTNLKEGTYFLTITDKNGCSGINSFQVNTNNWLWYPRAFFKFETCGNSASIIENCNNIEFEYLWSNGSTTRKATGLSIGEHYVTITNPSKMNYFVDTFYIASNQSCAFLEGFVKNDINKNCLLDNVDIPIQSKIIEILPGPFYATTDNNGYFKIPLGAGNYTVSIAKDIFYEKICQNNVSVNLTNSSMVDFSVQIANCPYLTVDISTPFLRRCFDNTYNVFYCNKGTTTAQDTYIEIKLDKDLTYKSSTIPLTSQSGNILRFDVGNVLPNECKNFGLTLNLSCNGTTLGQTHCVEAHIYPDSLCLPTSPTYSGAKVSTTANCNGNEVKLTIKNEGTAPMAADKSYIIIEDQVIYKQGNFKLNPNEILEFKYPANGKTYRIEAEQENGYPLIPSMPSAWIEACGTNSQGGFSTGFVSKFGNNSAEPFLAIDCHQSIGSYDPNEKQAYPIGYDKQHFINQNQPIEYILHFQNEGTDTAFTVVLLDTLSNLLDPRTLEMGASSHLYEWNLEGNGILKITFPKINLLTKKQDELASQGFVKFQIAQKKDLPLGSVIKNRAGIYFDFNDVILTNTVFHTLGKNFISITSLNDNEMPKFEVELYPNPTSDKATFVLPHLENQAIKFNVFDLTGRILYERQIIDNVFELDCTDIPNGIYLYQFSSKDAVLNKGRMSIVR